MKKAIIFTLAGIGTFFIHLDNRGQVQEGQL